MWRVVLLSCGILAFAGPAFAETYVVHPDGTGDFPTIQAAINAAVDGDVVELTDGTFTGEGNRDIDFLGKSITIRSQSGNPEACVIDCQGSDFEPHRGFQFVSGEGSGSVLEGVQVVNGYAPDAAPYHPAGGAVYCRDSSPTLRHCVLLRNSSEYQGGAIYCTGGSPVVVSCIFQENSADDSGGGAYCTDACTVDFRECTFVNNESYHAGSGMGGGVCCWYYTVAAFRNCAFSGNRAVLGGAVFLQAFCNVTIMDCLVSSNWALNNAGGIYWKECTGSLMDCRIVNNASEENAGGMRCWRSSPTVLRCTFSGNAASALGGALTCIEESYPVVSSCTITGNSAGLRGGCISVYFTSTLTIENSILAFSNDGEAVDCFDDGEATLRCCDVFGNAGGDYAGCIEDQYGVNGNICEDPLFCDSENGDFTLHGCSPCAPFSPPNPECDLIGAWPVGCGGTPTTRSTWGGVKALFRD